MNFFVVFSKKVKKDEKGQKTAKKEAKNVIQITFLVVKFIFFSYYPKKNRFEIKNHFLLSKKSFT